MAGPRPHDVSSIRQYNSGRSPKAHSVMLAKKPRGSKQHPKRCTNCRLAWCCSRDCQKADWKAHKGVIPTDTASGHRASRNVALETKIAKPFTALCSKKWLHGRSKTDVYKLLIDTYRYRIEYECNFVDDVAAHIIHLWPLRQV